MTKIEENIIEIAWVESDLMHANMFCDDTDSLDRKESILKLAYDFEKEYGDRDWDMKGDYYDTIYEYAEKNLLKEYGREYSGN